MVILLTPPTQDVVCGGMEDYPRTILELEERFRTESSCREYLATLRWPNGFVCPRCQAGDVWRASRGRLVCQACRYQASATAGTVFQDTHKPLRLWFRAIWQITSQKNGASAIAIQQVLGGGKLPDRLDVATQASPSDGSSRTGSPARACVGGRDANRHGKRQRSFAESAGGARRRGGWAWCGEN